MKYTAKINVTSFNPVDSKTAVYEAGKVYDESEIVQGLDMADFSPVDRTEVAETTEEEFVEKPKFSKMSREELDLYAKEHTNIDPSEYPKKGDLIEAIEQAL